MREKLNHLDIPVENILLFLCVLVVCGFAYISLMLDARAEYEKINEGHAKKFSAGDYATEEIVSENQTTEILEEIK